MATLLFQAFDVVDSYFQAKVNVKITSLARLVQLILSAAIKLFLIYVEAPLLWFAFAIFLDGVLLAFAYVVAIILAASSRVFPGLFDWYICRYLMKEAWPLMLSGLVVSLYMRIDQVMIGQMLGDQELGIYAAAVRISESWYFVPMAISVSLFPAIIALRNRSPNDYLRTMRNAYGFILWISLGFAGFIAMTSVWIMSITFGAGYEDGATVLVVHAWCGVFVGLGVISGKWLIAEGLHMFAMARTAAGAIANIILNFIWIPRYGIVGAAYATLVAQVIAALFSDLTYRPARAMFFLKIKALFYRCWPIW